MESSGAPKVGTHDADTKALDAALLVLFSEGEPWGWFGDVGGTGN